MAEVNNHSCLCGCGCYCKWKFVHGHNSTRRSVSKETRDKIRNKLLGRVRSERQRKNISNGHLGQVPWNKGLTCDKDVRICTPWLGKHRSEETREKLRRSHLGKVLSESHKERISSGTKKFYATEAGMKVIFSRFRKFVCKDFSFVSDSGKVTKMRSSWEVLYAKHLEKRGIHWEYEPKGFRLSTGKLYFPDFYIENTNEFHEIKSFITKEGTEKLNLFQRDYPNVVFRILRKQDLQKLGVME